MENETISGLALIIALVAIVGFAGLGAYAYFNQPTDVDLSGITINEQSINQIQNDIEDLEDDIEDIEMPDISEDDLEDLEDYASDFDEIDDNGNDIEDIISCLVEYDPADTTDFEVCIADL